MPNKRYIFTREQIEDAARTSESKTQMMRKLKIRQGGGGYQALLGWCKTYNVSPPDGKRVGSRNLRTRRLSDQEWFVDGIRRSGPSTRKRLVSRGIPDQCSSTNCPSPTPLWAGEKLTLQIDHINGDRWDNRLENLRILCPNCHTQTSTYSNNKSRRIRNYCSCGAEIQRASLNCTPCASQLRVGTTRVSWPPVDEMVKKLSSTSVRAYAIVLGVSDNGVRKYLKSQNIDIKQIKQPPVV